MATVTFVDESTSGGRSGEFSLEVKEPALPLRELLHRRLPTVPVNLIVLVGDRQIEDPDTVIDLTDDVEITLLTLIALVGG
jgi:hypothetical protein